MPEFVYTMRDLRKSYPGKEILKGLTLAFLPGAKIGILGPNGAGKSTVLKIMAGVDKEFVGEASAMKGVTVGYLPQEPMLDASKDVKGNIEPAVADIRRLLTRFDELSMKLGEDLSPAEMDKVMEEHGRTQDEIEAKNAWDLDHMLERAMDALRCPPGDQDVGTLSGGERRRVAMCRLLLEKPDLLLLDEPTNHLDAESVAWLERHLQDYSGTVVSITHDRYFLDNIAGWILELDRGAGIPFKGNYSGWLEQKQKRLDVEEKQASARKKTLEHEMEWIKQSPKARQAKSKARIQKFEELQSAAAMDKVAQAEIPIPPPPRLGNKVFDVQNIKKAYGDKLLFENLSFKVPPGAIVGIIGANGAGKSTLFRILTGQEKPDSGVVEVGDTVKVAYVDQNRDALVPDNSVWQEISEGYDTIPVGKKEFPSRAYVGAFGFKGSDQQKPVGTLSGGERNRVHLAKLLKSHGNVLLLDEPTNDLDVDTLRALEDALLSFAGCVMIISHDRWFLDRIATHILAFEGDSHVEWFEGNYEDYEKDRKKRLGADADQPHRLKYRKLTK